jgi:hypothetical protein
VSTRSSRGPSRAANAVGNARITGALGAAIFVLLFFEGLTILSIDHFMWLHVFLGTVIIVFVAMKIASTSYRFIRYYAGQPEYVRKGPPPVVLRVLGPVVTIATVGLLATGVGTLLSRRTHWLAFAHKASFVVWFGAMTLHVLGHALETPALAFADWRRSRRAETRGAAARLALLAVTAAVGIWLAILSLQWADHWRHLHGL